MNKDDTLYNYGYEQRREFLKVYRDTPHSLTQESTYMLLLDYGKSCDLPKLKQNFEIKVKMQNFIKILRRMMKGPKKETVMISNSE